MPQAKAAHWLLEWVEANVHKGELVEHKSEVRALAEQCLQAAKSAGISVAELKDAAGGNLEAYLMEVQNRLTEPS